MVDLEERIPLADMLEAVNKQIRAAGVRAEHNKDAVMKFAECEFEFAIEAEKKGEAGIEVYVAKLGGSLTRTETNTVKIKYISLETKDFFGAVQGQRGVSREDPARQKQPGEQ
ncbi:trypco2 family protein [Caballeronia sp. KNU42]